MPLSTRDGGVNRTPYFAINDAPSAAVTTPRAIANSTSLRFSQIQVEAV